MANVRSQSWRRPLTKLSPPPIPALLNTRSTWLAAWAWSRSSRNRSTCGSSETSQVWLVTRTPVPALAWASVAVSVTVPGFRSQVATEQPRAASCRTSSRPMPEPPPVTTASFPVKESIAATSDSSPPRRRRLLLPKTDISMIGM